MKSLLLGLFLIYNLIVAGQNPKLDKEHFLIGTIDDYMGHQQTFNANSDSFYFQQVDIYFQQEERTALLIKNLFQNNFPDLRLANNGAPKGIKLYSDSLSKIVNSYYYFKSSGTFTMKGDIIYTGYLNKLKFITNFQKISFLAGAYFRNSGSTADYRLAIPNSSGKAKVCEELLKAIGCKNVSYGMNKGRIPVGHFVTYEPTKELLAVLEIIDQYKLGRISDSDFINNLFK